MSNIFDYRPELGYMPKDINSINNISGQSLEQAEPYARSNTANIIDKVINSKTTLDKVRESIELKLKDFQIPMQVYLDDVLIEKVSPLKDSQKLINDGIMTYQFYKEIKDDPTLSTLEEAWDYYNSGLDGQIEAELLPYVDEIDNLLNGIFYLMENAILNDVPQDIMYDHAKLKEKELTDFKEYLRLKEKFINEMTHSIGNPLATKKAYEEAELSIDYKKNLVSSLIVPISKIGNGIRDIGDVIIPEYHTIQKSVIERELTSITSAVALSGINTKAIVYTAFLGQQKKVVEKKKNHNNLSKGAFILELFKQATVDCRLYKDVVIKSITELSNADSGLGMNIVGNIMIDGMERMTQSYRKSALSIRNILESNMAAIDTLINDTYKKDRTRVLYKSVGGS